MIIGGKVAIHKFRNALNQNLTLDIMGEKFKVKSIYEPSGEHYAHVELIHVIPLTREVTQ